MTVADADAARIIEHVDEHRDELLAFLVELVRIRSVFGETDYVEIAGRMEEAFAGLGARTAQISAPRARIDGALSYPRPNVVATLGGGGRPVVLLTTHMDVVHENDRAEWSHDPFSGTVSDGKVWGRGACDAKCCLAAQVFATRALIECGFELEGTLMLIASVDDEGQADRLTWPGMTFLAEEGLAAHRLPLPDLAINAEASGLDRICGSFMGKLVFEIPVLGEAAHAGTAHGVNAIEKARTLIARVEEIPLHEHAVQGAERRTLCAIHGQAERYGDIPPICTVGIEIRTVSPDGTERFRAELERALEDLAARDLQFRVGEITYFSDRAPFETPRDHALVTALAAAASRVGIEARYAPILGAGELQPLVAHAIPSVTYGAGSLDRVHRADEYVEIEEVVRQAQIYALAVLELCGGG